jgi:hypothetical protein
VLAHHYSALDLRVFSQCAGFIITGNLTWQYLSHVHYMAVYFTVLLCLLLHHSIRDMTISFKVPGWLHHQSTFTWRIFNSATDWLHFHITFDMQISFTMLLGWLHYHSAFGVAISFTVLLTGPLFTNYLARLYLSHFTWTILSITVHLVWVSESLLVRMSHVLPL